MSRSQKQAAWQTLEGGCQSEGHLHQAYPPRMILYRDLHNPQARIAQIAAKAGDAKVKHKGIASPRPAFEHKRRSLLPKAKKS